MFQIVVFQRMKAGGGMIGGMVVFVAVVETPCAPWRQVLLASMTTG